MKKNTLPVLPDKMDLVMIDRNQTWTTSKIVADAFGKNHFHVIRDIRKRVGDALDSASKSGCPNTDETVDPVSAKRRARATEFARKNFRESSYIDGRGKELPMYLLSEDAFLIVINKFSGELAEDLQITFVEEFQRMRAQLNWIRTNKQNIEWQEYRALGKPNRKELCAEIDGLVTEAKENGSKNYVWYFKHITDAIYKAIFNIADKRTKNLRERLSAKQLSILAAAETFAETQLNNARAEGMEYHECYEFVKGKLAEYGALVGRTSVPAWEPPALDGGQGGLL